MTVMEI